MTYDVDYFIAKFEAIPEELWFVNGYTDFTGRHCALGHCGETGNHFARCDEAETLQRILQNDTVPINDGYHPWYHQPTPKQRILAALGDVKEGRR